MKAMRRLAKKVGGAAPLPEGAGEAMALTVRRSLRHRERQPTGRTLARTGCSWRRRMRPGIPANAGIHRLRVGRAAAMHSPCAQWIPAFAGMTLLLQEAELAVRAEVGQVR